MIRLPGLLAAAIRNFNFKLPEGAAVGVLLAGLLLAASPAAAQRATDRPQAPTAEANKPKLPERETPAKLGAKIYREALSQFSLGNYQQAADLFSQVIRKYTTCESTSEAQVYLGLCLLRQKKDDDFLKQMDLVIKTYAGAEPAVLAAGLKITHLAGKKDGAGFADAIKDAASGGAKALPGPLLDPWAWYYHSNMAGVRYITARSWRDDVFKVCDKPEIAERVLAALAATFKQGPDKMPADWMWVHCFLLFQSQKDAEAEKALKDYAEFWGDDVRGRQLWWEYGQYLLTVRKKPADARKVYELILDRYAGTDTAGEAGSQIAALLAADAAKSAEFFGFAEPFVEKYKLSEAGNRVSALALRKAIDLAPKEPAMAAKAAIMLEQGLDRLPAVEKAARLESLVKLAVATGQMPKAAGLMKEFLADDLWSASVYARALALAKANPELNAAVKQAQRRHQVFEMPSADAAAGTPPDTQPDAAGLADAAKLLADLETRIKDEQMRFAEEIAEELFARHQNTAAAVQGVSRMCDYYFSKVIPAPRDKWMERMISAYPTHPQTEAILHKRCVTDRAQSEFASLAKHADLALDRFPTSENRGNWNAMRLACYDAAKDPAGKHALLAKELDWSAAQGNLYNLQQIVESTPAADGQRGDVVGAAYEAWAKRLGQTQASLSCWAMARSTYENYRLYDKALAASKVLREQAKELNPAVAWRYAFDDIELLVAQGKGADAASEAVKRLPGEPKPQFRQVRRLNMGSLGYAFGKAGRLEDCRTLWAKLSLLYKFPEDQDAADLMLANAFTGAEDPSLRAADILAKIARRVEPPDMGYGTLAAALGQARGNPDAYADLINEFMRANPKAAHLLPKLLGTLGQYCLARRDGRTVAIQGQLERSYPASAAHDELDEAVAKARENVKGN